MIRFLLLIALICNTLGSGKRIKQDSNVYERLSNEEQVQRYDDFFYHLAEEPQAPVGSFLRSMSSPRVGSSRPSRLLPNQGGKPTHHSGRWVNKKWSNFSNGFILLLCKSLNASRTTAASQRLYYVIALRRLLC